MHSQTKKYVFIFIRALILSVVLYGVVIYHSSDNLVKNEQAQFRLLTKTMQDYKSTLYIMGVMFEAQVEANRGKFIEERTFARGKIYYYDDDKSLTHNEKVISTTAEKMFGSMPEMVDAPSYSLYYRSYEGQKLMSAKSFDISIEVVKSAFSEKSCLATSNCAYYVSPEDLSNRLVVSDVHKDKVTGQPTITLSSPVYDDMTMIGDVNVDIYLNYFSFLKHKTFVSAKNGDKRQVIIESLRYPFHKYAFYKQFTVDDYFEFVYLIPYSKLVIDSSWLLVLFIVVLFYIFVKLEELQIKRERLKQAEIAICRDELTGIYNRTILKDSALKYIKEKQGMSVIVIDGDGLKAINDTHGHHIGDEAIIHIAKRMRVNFRDSDYLIRSGGDEFLILLPCCSDRTAHQLAERLTKDIASTPFGEQALKITISFGVSQVQVSENLDTAIQRADNLLYKDKRSKMRKSEQTRRHHA
ncbi:sensor domain-containing diguanylate cyclase [Vibrio sp. 10N]|uniref:sensor domain-containing diguanylate cyclase n=1 Tax=Vibrio sp. 10N TaxID=3058938 RepID=UPI0028145254|nr:GGDEF domain-containing protein [Vibrio sp. 10N]